MKLYEISEALQRVETAVEEETAVEGNVGDAYKVALDALEGEFKDKAEGVIALIRNLEAEGKMFNEEARRLNDHARSRANHADSLKRYLYDNMVVTNQLELVYPLFKAQLQKGSPSCEVQDEGVIPDDYWRVIPETREVDKRAIMAAATKDEQGYYIPPCQGVAISQALHLRIR